MKYVLLYTSADGGTTWTARGTTGDWYRTGMSDNGQLMVVGEHINGILSISRDGLRQAVREQMAAEQR